MNGTIGISPRPGGGSIFWFSIPCEVITPSPIFAIGDKIELIYGNWSDAWHQAFENLFQKIRLQPLWCPVEELEELLLQFIDGPRRILLFYPEQEIARVRDVITQSQLIDAANIFCIFSGNSFSCEERQRNLEEFPLPYRFLKMPIYYPEFSEIIRDVAFSETIVWQPAPAKETSISGDISKKQYKGKVLVVEDNLTNQQVAMMLLSHLGLDVQVAVNGIQAIKFLQKERVELIFMDCRMPQMDGYETTRRIRMGKAGEWAKNIPIIAMTANALTGDRQQCIQAGMNDFIAKPIDQRDLHRILSNYLPYVEADREQDGQAHDDAPKPELTDTEKMIFDKEDFLQRVMGDPALVKILLQVFLDDLPTKMSAIENAINSGPNWEDLGLYAHGLKGAAANVGAIAIQKQAEALELGAKKQQSNVQESGQKLKEEVLRFQEVIQKEMKAQ